MPLLMAAGVFRIAVIRILTTSWGKAPVDLLTVKAEGTVSAGTIKRVTSALSLTETGHATFVENVTLTGSGAILFRRRIEAKDALEVL